jgi:hypothetical protein
MAFSDIDGDVDQDVLIGQYLYTNDNGNFMKLTAPFKSVDNECMAFSDIDGDGDQDVLITGSNGRWNYYRTSHQ